MFRERWKSVRAGIPGAGSPSSAGPRSNQGQPVDSSRHSNGLEQFFSQIAGPPGLTILDLSAASQSNVAFITSLGHSLSSEDLIASLQHEFGPEFLTDQSDPRRIARFLDQNLNYFGKDFDGVLAWDVLEYISPPLLNEVVRRLHILMRPGSYIFAVFHGEERTETIPCYSYRIEDAETMLLHPKGQRRRAQLFNNRALERLFQQFASVKFFLSRDNLREVLVKR